MRKNKEKSEKLRFLGGFYEYFKKNKVIFV